MNISRCPLNTYIFFIGVFLSVAMVQSIWSTAKMLYLKDTVYLKHPISTCHTTSWEPSASHLRNKPTVQRTKGESRLGMVTHA